jgi:hypothetical protein
MVVTRPGSCAAVTIGMESDQITSIKDRPQPISIWDVQVLLGFATFYTRFIRKYAKVTLPLTERLKTTTKTAHTPSISKCQRYYPQDRLDGRR